MMSFVCRKCDGKYASSQSLWNHKQRCKHIDPRIDRLVLAKSESRRRSTIPKMADLTDALINNPSANDLQRYKRMENDDTSRPESDDNVQRTKADIVGYNNEKT